MSRQKRGNANMNVSLISPHEKIKPEGKNNKIVPEKLESIPIRNETRLMMSTHNRFCLCQSLLKLME